MIIEKLKKAENFSEIDKSIANYILKNGSKIKDISIQTLAKETYSSPATIIRLCKKVGVKGYQEFRIKFYAEFEETVLYKENVNTNIPFVKGAKFEEIVSNLANINIKTITETAKNFDYSHMNEIINKLNAAEEIYVFGTGSSLIAALEFKTKLLRIGKRVHLEEGTTNQQALAANADKNTFCILISHSGSTPFIVNISNILKKTKCFTLAITSDPESIVARNANLCLPIMNHEEKELNKKLETFTSHNAIHFLLDCIYSFVFAQNYDENSEKIKSANLRMMR
ncbi:MurR/RpiR family transcriptional regulator [Konateibacter massiliensis]|uniref:MurR/RpiR family transcriptional regulator n=1 Tax=Konateibacter massiliensis TaxID=2002841 RepID=UPI000C152A43|nr:MurR/RpiR family transcriptional regulator [Konateibacter massiliensis]